MRPSIDDMLDIIDEQNENQDAWRENLRQALGLRLGEVELAVIDGGLAA